LRSEYWLDPFDSLEFDDDLIFNQQV